jgi:hypothetical protein
MARDYERIGEATRNGRRTVADGLDVLRKAASFADHNRAEVRIGPLELPSGDRVGLVDIWFEVPALNKVYVVSLATSASFRGILDGTCQRAIFDISCLHGATIDGYGEVTLRDGSKLRAVEMIPTRLLRDPTKLDWRIVHHTLAIIKAEHCYRSVWEDVPFPTATMVPLRFLDCARLARFDLPSLKKLRHAIAQRDWTLRNLSEQKLTDALRKFGMRVPPPRPRRIAV